MLVIDTLTGAGQQVIASVLHESRNDMLTSTKRICKISDRFVDSTFNNRKAARFLARERMARNG